MAQPVVAILAALGLLFAAAKMHGRQVRLRRVVEGHGEADFRKPGNHPFVEELWRRDRQTYWSIAALAAVALVAAIVLRQAHPMWLWLVLLVPLPMSFAFTVMACWWWFDAIGSSRRLGAEAHVGSIAWLTLVVTLVVVLGIAL